MPVNGVMPCWTGDEEYDVYEGVVVLSQTGSDEAVNTVVCASRLEEPVNGVMPCWTGVEECVIYDCDFALPRSDEAINCVVCTSVPDYPDGPCVEDSNSCESAVALRRTGSDQTVNNVVNTVGPGGPGNET